MVMVVFSTSTSPWQFKLFSPTRCQGGYFQMRRGGGGLDLTSSSEAKFGARSGQVHQIRGKTWEVLSPQDAKVGKVPVLGSSEIHGAKFGVFATYISGGKIWGSNKNFRGKFWGQAPPNLLIWKYSPPPPPWHKVRKATSVQAAGRYQFD